jgi:hypothetical protein
MATSRLKDGDKKMRKQTKKECKNAHGKECETSGEKDDAKNRKSKYRKEVIYDVSHGKPETTKVVEKTRLVVSDGIKEEEKPETKGIVFEGQTSQRTTESGNKQAGKDDISRAKEIRYFKKRSKLGKMLTGKEEKQMGGRFESQTKAGEKEVISFKGKGRGAKKYTEKGDIKEEEKEDYVNKKKELDSKLVKDWDYDSKLSNMSYVKKRKSGGTDEHYQIGTNEKGKELKVRKETYKDDILNDHKNRKKDVKVTRTALSKVRLK